MNHLDDSGFNDNEEMHTDEQGESDFVLNHERDKTDYRDRIFN